MSATINWNESVTNRTDITQTSQEAELDVFKDYIFHVLEILTNCIMVNIIGVFGVIGNCINIIVLSKYGFRETTTIILIALSVCDLLLCSMLLLTRLKCVIRQFNKGFALTVSTFSTLFLFMPKYMCLATGVVYVTTIAVERFTAVFFPFTVHRIFKTRVTKVFVFVVPVVVLILLTPTFQALTYSWQFNSDLQQTVAVLEYTQFYLHHQAFLDFYAWIILNYFFSTFSIIIILLCCIAIVVKLLRASVKRELMTSRSTGYDVKVVKMLVAVCVVFLAVFIPNLALYAYFVPHFIFVSPLHEFVDNVCAVLYAVNSSANFLVYVTMSAKFARTYKRLFSWKCR